MKSNKGFTLIELLAVIVILAIIALIATPMILGVINTAKEGSAKTSAQYYVEAVEKSMMTAQLDESKAVADDTYTVSKNSTTITGTKGGSFTVNYKGDAAEGTVVIKNGKVESASLKFANIIDKDVYVDANGNASFNS